MPESDRMCDLCGNEPGFLAFHVEGRKLPLMLGRTCAAWVNAQAREERRHA
jgi:hypothetical protein